MNPDKSESLDISDCNGSSYEPSQKFESRIDLGVPPLKLIFSDIPLESRAGADAEPILSVSLVLTNFSNVLVS